MNRLPDEAPEEIEISDKHVPLRTALFVLAFLIAVGSFAFAVNRIGHKEAGYYSITADPNDAAPLYVNSASLRYRFTGGSKEIKASLLALQKVYNEALLESYELLDAETEYPGVTNPATLNAHIGEPVSVDAALYEILLDAREKTKEGRGYNLLAGPFYAEWEGLLYLEDASEFDPLVNADEAARLERLAALVNDPAMLSLTVVDEATRTLRLDADPALLAALEELECSAPLLDLNLLHDAYLLQLVAAKLEENGFDSGYLSTAGGLSLCLSAMERGEFRLYGFDGENTTSAAAAIAESGAAASQMHVFSYEAGTAGFYTIEDADGVHYRHPYVPADGRRPEKLRSSLTVDEKGSPVEACYLNLCLNSLPTLREARALAAETDSPVAFTTEAGGKTVYVNAAGVGRIAADTDYGYETEEIA